MAVGETKSTREMQETHRLRIKTSMIINALQKHVEKKIEMSSTQVKAAEILLKKTLPDTKEIEHKGEVGLKVAYLQAEDKSL